MPRLVEPLNVTKDELTYFLEIIAVGDLPQVGHQRGVGFGVRLHSGKSARRQTQEMIVEEADYLVSGQGRRGTVRLIRSGEVSEVGARK